jgi:hypothetical protein
MVDDAKSMTNHAYGSGLTLLNCVLVCCRLGGIEGLDACMGEGFISVLYTNEIICY